MSCIAYVACKMTGRDRQEMVARAKYICAVLKQYGITPISPVIEEGVVDAPGPLVTNDEDFLRRVWRRDKEIIRYEAHVVIFDGAEAKSFGMEREYGLSRNTLWKPTMLLVKEHHLSVADFEDDFITTDPHELGAYVRAEYGTRWKRWKWRMTMLNRTFPSWFMDQVYQWR